MYTRWLQIPLLARYWLSPSVSLVAAGSLMLFSFSPAYAQDNGTKAPAAPVIPATNSSSPVELKPLPIPDTVPATLPERFNVIMRARKTLANGSNVKMNTKFYIDNGNIRYESGFPAADKVFIVNAKRNIGYLLDLPARTYFEAPVNPGVMTLAMLLPPSRPKWELTAKEEIKDVPCEVLTFIDTNKAAGPTALRFWRAKETWYPVRLVDEATDSMIEWIEWKIGPQEPSLFEPPTGFKQVKAPQEQQPEAPKPALP